MKSVVKKCFISAFSVAMLSVGIYGVVVFANHKTEPDEEPLAAYEAVLKEFNAEHGTNYSFLSDEQLERKGQTREEYNAEMEQAYADLTPEEFRENLEAVYSGNQVDVIAGFDTKEEVFYVEN